MALPPQFLDELRVRTPLAALIGRRTKLGRSGREWKGCCPFHNEKTPSFYVYDDHYHCFGCGAHGDAIGFVMQSEGRGFVEAVESLAAEAGMEVPKPSPAAAEAEQQRAGLHEVLEAAQRAFARRLMLPEGRAALEYLRGRGLGEETIRRFGLGWSGEGRGALAADLAREGIEVPQLVEAGLMKGGEGERQVDLFFNRVMFPIRDRRGRVISFGGRILGEGQPKYVNGPETALFSKRRTLYALDLAREAARRGAPVVAVEGYMDVIALHEAGFAGAVAPLGTALTGEQLEELWRLSPAPVLCFDGDAAGSRAAARAAEIALPMLGPERTLRLAALPAGEDPDTLVRRQGAAGFQAVVEAARPLAVALFDLLREGTGGITPEARAAFRARLEAAAGRIADRPLASEYRRALLDRFFGERRGDGRRGPGGRFASPKASAHVSLARPSASEAGTIAEQGRVLTAILLTHPHLMPDVEEAFAMLDLPLPLARIRAALSAWVDGAPALDSSSLMNHLTQVGLEGDAARALTGSPLPACAMAEALPAEAAASWWQIYGLMRRSRLDEEVAAASRDFTARADAASERRLVAIATARAALARGEQDADA
ncbi:MAG TPA: DNA primase [Acetobacteraceae bacterium]|nr:DNA primase [Acetobacteraceae bacterium]